MQPDLLERARSASSLEEEALVIFEAAQHSALPVEQRRELCRIIMMAGKEVPRAVLLGVVAALKPANYGMDIRGPYIGLDRDKWEAEIGAFDGSAVTPALALLIAILEASNAE